MIRFNEANRTFKIDTENTSYIFGIEQEFGYAVHYYYGPKLSGDNVGFLSRSSKDKATLWSHREKCGYVDNTPVEFPTTGIGDFREDAIVIETKGGFGAGEFVYKTHNIFKGKKKLEGLPATFGDESDVETLELILEDDLINFRVILSYSVFAGSDALVRSVKLENLSDKDAVYINRIMSTTLDIDNRDFELMTHTGAWGREHQIDRRRICRGTQGVSSKRGISSAQEHPFIALTSKNISQTEGEIYGFSLVYSGNFTAVADMDQFDRIRVAMGINPERFRWKLEPGKSFTTPEVVCVYSREGIGHMTRTYHDLYRNHLIRSPYRDKQRPILLNNWEATYFNFNTEKLLSIAKEAAKRGIEMLVMDDGWFGKRNSDDCSLGDWIVNEEKLPGGLKPLVDGVNALGLKFGIWMEPEMVCPDSDLFRAHPDWAIQVPGREGSLARFQYVLDLTREDVWQHTWNSIKNVLKSANIEYLKWDMNRAVTDIGSAALPADRQGEFSHRYMLGVYRLQEALITEFPNLLLENCSSGGGRFDAGMLYYGPQTWASDDTDAIERLKIQEGTAMIYPLSSMGAHVSDCPNHGTGRTTPFKTRGDVALAGTFGYELDITKIAPEEQEMISEQVKTYKKYNDLVRAGDYYRLASYAENNKYDAWMVKAKDESEFLVTFVNVYNRINSKSVFLRLQGLKPDKLYKEEETGREFTGDILMYAGVEIKPESGDFKSRLIHFTEVK